MNAAAPSIHPPNPACFSCVPLPPCPVLVIAQVLRTETGPEIKDLDKQLTFYGLVEGGKVSCPLGYVYLFPSSSPPPHSLPPLRVFCP